MTLEKKLAKALKALEHYANVENWGKTNYPKYNEHFPVDERWVWQAGTIEPWKFAKDTLKKLGVEDESIKEGAVLD